MDTKYNIRVSYNGEGQFPLHVRGLGEIQLEPGRDIYLKNATAEIVQDLRSYVTVRVNIQIGAKPQGCFKTFDLDRTAVPYRRVSKLNYRSTGADLNAIRKQNSEGLLTLEDAEIPTVTGSIREKVDGEPLGEAETTNEETIVKTDSPADYVLTSTSHVGESIGSLKPRVLSGIYKYANDEDQAMIDAYKETIKAE